MPINSIVDQLTKKLSPLTRKLKDLNMSILGTQTQILRISTTTPDLFGETTESLQTQFIDKAIIKHPWAGDVQLFGSVDTAGDNNSASIDLWEILPISITFPFEGDRSGNPIDLKKGDILIECLRDEHDNKIPLIMEVTRLFGSFSNKYMVSKRADCTLFRGTLPVVIQSAIDIYIQSIE